MASQIISVQISILFSKVWCGLYTCTHKHAKVLPGPMLETFHGLCGKLKMVCTEGSNGTCEQWVGGAWTWHSDARVNLSMEKSKARSEYGLNLKYATAMAMGPGTKAAGHALLCNMQFRPRHTNVHDSIIKCVVLPYVLERKREIEAQNLRQINQRPAWHALIIAGTTRGMLRVPLQVWLLMEKSCYVH